MPDHLSEFLPFRRPAPGLPLAGLTILVVEDSRFACEALRLLCLRSGARIRRADCLASARRHLCSYRPAAVIVDLGLPDGSGLELITDLAAVPAPAPAIVATSGDPASEPAALAAGATAFLAKPVESLAAFQRGLRAAMAQAGVLQPPAVVTDAIVHPDPLAFRDDIRRAASVLRDGPDGPGLGYVAQFLAGVARSAHDAVLEKAAADLARDCKCDAADRPDLSRLTGLMRDRLGAAAPI